MHAKDLLPWNWHKKSAPVERGARSPERELRRGVDALFDDFFGRRGLGGWLDEPPWREEGFLPALDVEHTDDAVSVRLELPGMDEQDVEVTVDDDVLTIRGEKRSEKEEKRKGVEWRECRYGSFERGIPLPPGLDLDAVRARFKRGVLTVTLPKQESARGAAGRTIRVETG